MNMDNTLHSPIHFLHTINPIYQTTDGRPGQIYSGTSSLQASVPALLQAAAGRHVKLLGLDERVLLSITTVSSAEWLPLITANIISHEESQSALRSIGGDKDASSEAFQVRLKAGSWRRHMRWTVWLFAFSVFRGGGSVGGLFRRQLA